MVTADGLRALTTLAIVVLLLTGALEFWMLVVVAAGNGALSLAFSLARSAWMAEQVPAAQLTTRNAQMSAATSTFESVAFAGGGYIYQWLGPTLAPGRRCHLLRGVGLPVAGPADPSDARARCGDSAFAGGALAAVAC